MMSYNMNFTTQMLEKASGKRNFTELAERDLASNGRWFTSTSEGEEGLPVPASKAFFVVSIAIMFIINMINIIAIISAIAEGVSPITAEAIPFYAMGVISVVSALLARQFYKNEKNQA